MLKFVNFKSQMGVNLNRFSINSQRWKYAISTGNMYLIRIFAQFCFKFYQNGSIQRLIKRLVFATVKELIPRIKY